MLLPKLPPVCMCVCTHTQTKFSSQAQFGACVNLKLFHVVFEISLETTFHELVIGEL